MASRSVVRGFCSYIADVKAEVGRVTWSSRKEVIVTTIVVFVMALIASLFFALVDTAWYKIVHVIIGQ
ncbi:MAG: preprotein translocase subunit SecE [Holosporales bacterium]|jgi:preprotein translocase SecE subunit|nr:preprotein translocase subunit SecE [Holosporales bacterium]